MSKAPKRNNSSGANKTCKHCGKEFKAYRSTEKACSLNCALALARAKIKKEEGKAWKERKRKGREELKTYADKVNDARRVFQKYVRKRDSGLPCISCGNEWAKQWHAGHFKKAELFRGVIFHELGCNKQCLRCNNYLDGNELPYREALVRRYGEDRVRAFERLANMTRGKKWTDKELECIKDRYKAKYREL